MLNKWVEKYIGLSFQKANCWQLVCKVYNEQFGIDIKDFNGEYSNAFDKDSIKAIYEREMQIWQRIKKPAVGDIIVLRVEGQPWHCGIVLNDNYMLHTQDKINAAIEKFTGLIWRNRIVGFYRHKKI